MKDHRELLTSLRWREDQKVINDFGEPVWLGPCFDGGDKRIGITDCCFVDSPCEWHAAFSKVLSYVSGSR